MLRGGIAAARARSDEVDALISSVSTRSTLTPESVAIVALGAYGRRELTPSAEIDLLFLSPVELPAAWLTETMCYPLWERNLRVEPVVRTPADCSDEARRSWSAATSFLDARLVAGNALTFAELVRGVVQPWRRDRGRLLHRLRTEVQRRHVTHDSATASTTPNLIAGRGGLQDAQALRWLSSGAPDECLLSALDFLLQLRAELETLVEHPPQTLSFTVQEQLAERLGFEDEFALLRAVYDHTRWVAFQLDNVLAPRPDDRQLGTNFALTGGSLIANRIPPLVRAPHLPLRVATLVGLAAPDPALFAWAAQPGPPLVWDEAARAQFWLLLRAADWRAWDFLDITGLLVRYIPEFAAIWRRRGPSAAHELALDTHSFMAVRRLHEWTDNGDPFAERVWRSLRRRDWVYLTVLLHELEPANALAAAQRLGLPEEACDSLSFAVENYRQLAETATRRDLRDEDLLFDLAVKIRTRQRLSVLFLVAAAHDLAAGASSWSAWRADLMRQLFGLLEAMLRQGGDVRSRRVRSLDHHRDRISEALQRRGLGSLVALVARLPRRYVLTRSPSFIVRHLGLLADNPLADGEVRMRAYRHRQPGWWDVLVVARDRPGLLATVAGVIALRGASTLAADAATCPDGLVLDVFTVAGAAGEALEQERWPAIAADVQAALEGRVPLSDLLGARRLPPEEADSIHVSIDNEASQFFSVVEVRAPDQVGLLYRITDGLHELGLDIHHARIATHPEGVLDVLYVWDLQGEKLDEQAALTATAALTAHLRGDGVRYTG